MVWPVAWWRVAGVLAQFVAFFTQVVARTSWQNVHDVVVLLATAWVTIVCTAALLRGVRSVLWGLALLAPVLAFAWQSGVVTPEAVAELWRLVPPLPMNVPAQ